MCVKSEAASPHFAGPVVKDLLSVEFLPEGVSISLKLAALQVGLPALPQHVLYLWSERHAMEHFDSGFITHYTTMKKS